MKVFYFKSQDISEAKRNEDGVIETTPEGKTIQDDYYSIQLKIPKRECTIDWRDVVRWSKMELIMPWEKGSPGKEFSRLELFQGCASLLEGMLADIRERIQEDEEEEDDGGGVQCEEKASGEASEGM